MPPLFSPALYRGRQRGGGKVPIESSLLRIEADAYVLRGAEGGELCYPRER